MKYILSILLLTLSFSHAEVVVNETVRTVEGIGVGLSRQEAVSNALAEACGQINGVQVSATKFISDTTVETSTSEKSEFIFNKQIKSITKGKVDSYSIVDVMENNGEYEATVSVTKTDIKKEYKTPGHNPNKRRKLAVVPSYSGSNNFQILGSMRNPREVTQRLTQELVSSVTKTRKFTVLDRENNDAYNKEKNQILSRDSQKDEMLKLGNVLGADYLFVSNITDFKIYNDKKVSRLTGRTSNNLKTYATVQYRILAMATKQIKWSSTTTFEFEPSGSTNEQIFLSSLKKISEDLTYELIENIFPLKIVDISSNGRAIINQGSEVGQVYDVYKLGKKLYDSYTKEFLGQDEILIGKIQTTRALPKVSYAEVIEGDIEKGAICRKSKSQNQNNEVSDDEIGTESGFSL